MDYFILETHISLFGQMFFGYFINDSSSVFLVLSFCFIQLSDLLDWTSKFLIFFYLFAPFLGGFLSSLPTVQLILFIHGCKHVLISRALLYSLHLKNLFLDALCIS